MNQQEVDKITLTQRMCILDSLFYWWESLSPETIESFGNVNVYDLVRNSLVSEDVKEVCKDGWHKDKNMWAYVDCDCPQCKEGRAEIALRVIEEWITTLPPRKPQVEISRLGGYFGEFIDYLTQQKNVKGVDLTLLNIKGSTRKVSDDKS